MWRRKAFPAPDVRPASGVIVGCPVRILVIGALGTEVAGALFGVRGEEVRLNESSSIIIAVRD